MISTTAIGIARLTIGFQVLVALLPLDPVGAWMVRLCDFPRLQLVILMLLPAAAISIYVSQHGWNNEATIAAVTLLLVLAWQMSHVVRYTPIWPVEVESAPTNSRAPLRVVVANLMVENPQREKVLETLQATEADLLLLLEVDDRWANALRPIANTLPYRVGVSRENGLGIMHWVSATTSKRTSGASGF